jgi:hypothetical protein
LIDRLYNEATRPAITLIKLGGGTGKNPVPASCLN